MKYPLSFYGASALNVYPLQNDPPPLLIELVEGGGQLVVVGGSLRGWSACPVPTPPCALQVDTHGSPPTPHTLFFFTALAP